MTAAKLPPPYAERLADIEARLAEVRTWESELIRQREDLYAEHAGTTAVFKVGDYVQRKPTKWDKAGPVVKVLRVHARVVTIPERRMWAPEKVSCSLVYTCRIVTASGSARGAEVTFTDASDYKVAPAPKVKP